MSLFHNSIDAEKVALTAHGVWAVASVLSAAFSIAAIYFLFPWMVLGSYFFAMVLVHVALVVLGLSGTIWHIWGARQHQERIKVLESNPTALDLLQLHGIRRERPPQSSESV